MTNRADQRDLGRWLSACLTVAGLSLLPAGYALAEQDPDEASPVVVRLSPWSPPEGTEAADAIAQPGYGNHFKRLLSVGLAPDADEASVAVDRRLLELVVRPADSRRRYRCRHPDRPRRGRDARRKTLAPGAEATEWVDLRMYCWGRALDALSDGATVEATYGFRRRGRDRCVWCEGERRDHVRQIELERFELDAAPERTRDADAPIRVEMSPRRTSREAYVRFVVAASASEAAGRQRVYIRPDQWRFYVRGPLGEVMCRLPRRPVSPIVDFFRTVTTRRRVRDVLDATAYCPEGTFEAAGVYDVTPILDLPYSGDRYDLEAATGTFVGVPTPVRIDRGELGYVEQDPSMWSNEDTGDTEDAALTH